MVAKWGQAFLQIGGPMQYPRVLNLDSSALRRLNNVYGND